jgi:hypothetical protein
MSNKKWKKFGQVKIIWEKYEKKVVLASGLILIAVISFEVGILQGHKFEQKTLIVEKAPEIAMESPKAPETAILGVQSINNETKDLKSESTIKTKECMFVGSKNSDKYHKPDCRFAKNIKPENIVCFKNEEDAKSKGYVGDKGCIK